MYVETHLTRSVTLAAAQRHAGHRNALNFVRLVLAAAVLAVHAYPLNGRPEPGWAWASEFAVYGFFGLSGYLISASRTRLPWRPFVRNRVLRILPALLVCLVVTAFVFAPLAGRSDGWQVASAVNYVLANSLIWVGAFDLTGTLTNMPGLTAWNGSLWTLGFEFLAYLGAGWVVGALPSRARRPLLVAALVALLIGTVIAGPVLGIVTNFYLHLLRLGSFFLAGMVIQEWREQVRLDRRLAGLSLLLVGLAIWLPANFHQLFSALPLTYLLLWLGYTLPIRVGAVNDLSYGTYIYAFPVQQLIVSLGGAELPLLASATLTGAGTAVCAGLSWRWVERPMQRLARSWQREETSRPARWLDKGITLFVVAFLVMTALQTPYL